MTISGEGSRSEQRFRAITGWARPTGAALGDAEFTCDGATAYVEVKKVGLKKDGRTSSDTINQVRAVKYNTLVVFRELGEQWYAVPADVVLELVSQKGRGQHTENPFESATLSLASLERYQVAEDQLKAEVLAAHRLASRRRDYIAFVASVLRRSRELAATARREFQALNAVRPAP